jgi:hypothetical protein
MVAIGARAGENSEIDPRGAGGKNRGKSGKTPDVN